MLCLKIPADDFFFKLKNMYRQVLNNIILSEGENCTEGFGDI